MMPTALIGPSPVPRRRDGRSPALRETGFTLAAVLVLMAAMAILMTVAVQTATFQAKREKEEELIFRGKQIVEGVRLFRARNGRFPNSLVELAEADPRAVRRVWSDPVTGRPDWVPIFLGQEGQQLAGGVAPRPGQPQPGFGQPGPTPTVGPEGFPPTEASGPVVGAHSRSCAKSIKLVDGRDRYCDWKFVFDPQQQQQPPPSGGGGVRPDPGRGPGGGRPGGPPRPPGGRRPGG